MLLYKNQVSSAVIAAGYVPFSLYLDLDAGCRNHAMPGFQGDIYVTTEAHNYYLPEHGMHKQHYVFNSKSNYSNLV